MCLRWANCEKKENFCYIGWISAKLSSRCSWPDESWSRRWQFHRKIRKMRIISVGVPKYLFHMIICIKMLSIPSLIGFIQHNNYLFSRCRLTFRHMFVLYFKHTHTHTHCSVSIYPFTARYIYLAVIRNQHRSPKHTIIHVYISIVIVYHTATHRQFTIDWLLGRKVVCNRTKKPYWSRQEYWMFCACCLLA